VLGHGHEQVAGRAGAFSGDGDRPLGGQQAPGELLDVDGRRLHRRGLRHDGTGQLDVDEVTRDRDRDRAGAAGGRDPPPLRHQAGYVLGALGRDGPLGDRAVERGEVDLLEGLSTAQLRVDLPEQHDHGRRVLVGRVHPDREVRRARPAARHGHRGNAGEPGVRIGHEGRTRFVSH
jgi:hypothetical protein